MLTTYGTVRSECELLPRTHIDEHDDADEEVADAWYNKVQGVVADMSRRVHMQVPKGRKNKKEKAYPVEMPMLATIAWRRIVLDEAHMIKNHTSASAKVRVYAYRCGAIGLMILTGRLALGGV